MKFKSSFFTLFFSSLRKKIKKKREREREREKAKDERCIFPDLLLHLFFLFDASPNLALMPPSSGVTFTFGIPLVLEKDKNRDSLQIYALVF